MPPQRLIATERYEPVLNSDHLNTLTLTKKGVGCRERTFSHTQQVQAPIFKYGKRKKKIFETRSAIKLASMFETPDFNYGVPTPYTLHPIPYTLFIEQDGKTTLHIAMQGLVKYLVALWAISKRVLMP